MHTRLSDGRLAPEELVAALAGAGIDVAAITDHDLPPPLQSGTWKVGRRYIRLIEAAEVSGAFEGRELHLLVYFPGEMPPGFRSFLRDRAMLRARRYRRAIENTGLPGLPDADEDALEGRRALTRVHVAQAIVAAGHAADVRAAMASWTGQHHGLVPLVEQDFVAAIHEARAAGAITSWAHPTVEEAARLAPKFAREGLTGLEVTRPGQGRVVRSQLQRIAHRNGLLFTGGSDFHGWSTGQPGNFTFPSSEARAFVKALGLRL